MSKNTNGLVISTICYNIANSIIVDELSQLNRVYKKYHEKYKPIKRNIIRRYHNLSLDNWGDGNYVSVVDPYILQKCSDSFSYWINEQLDTLLLVINRVLDFNERDLDNCTTEDLIEFREALEDIERSQPTQYEIRRKFKEQGPHPMRKPKLEKTTIGDYFEKSGDAYSNLERLQIELESLIDTSDLLVSHTHDLKVRDKRSWDGLKKEHFEDARMQEADFYKYQVSLGSIIKRNMKVCNECAMKRFVDLYKAIEIAQVDLDTIQKGVGK